MLLQWPSSARAWCAIACIACGSAEQGRDALGFEARRASPGAEGEPEPEPQDFLDDDRAYVQAPSDACATSNVVLREPRRPIDIILVLDNSVSMAGELEAVERNINTHFARILDESGVDYRVIMVSRHRTGDRTRSEQAETAICITEPLSALASCPASAPGSSARFFHYSIDIDSHDSLSRLLAAYDQPDPLYAATATGWSAWLREGARKVFLALTDDDSFTEPAVFMAELAARAPQHFGPSPSQPSYVFHSIVGVAEREPADAAYGPEEPLVTERCRNAERLAPNAGRAYQTLSRLTGGLRYPLCHLDNYDAIFESIAADSIDDSGLGCRFAAPVPPAGKRLDLEQLQLRLSGGRSGSAVLSAVPGAERCDPQSFYVEDEHIVLCPDFCSALLDQPSVTLSAVFDCSAFSDVR
jgi:hypothetical protein